MAGSCVDFDLFLSYTYSEDFPYQPFSHKVEGIAIGEKYAYYIETDSGFFIRMDRKTHMASGSGSHYVLSALSLGHDSIQAIKHAAKFDAATGLKVQHLEL